MSARGPNRLKAEGRACPLCPLNSDVNLFRYPERVVELDAEVADRALESHNAPRLNSLKVKDLLRGILC